MQKESEGVLELQIGGAVYMLGVFFFKVSSPFHFLSMVQVSMCCADSLFLPKPVDRTRLQEKNI